MAYQTKQIRIFFGSLFEKESELEQTEKNDIIKKDIFIDHIIL
jgi:hypothetical protein